MSATIVRVRLEPPSVPFWRRAHRGSMVPVNTFQLTRRQLLAGAAVVGVVSLVARRGQGACGAVGVTGAAPRVRANVS